MARPSELTPEVLALVADGIAKAVPPAVAAQAAGISRATFYAWLARGRADEAAGRSTPHRGFLDAIKEAEAVAQSLLLETIRLASSVATPKDMQAPKWQAAAWLLERRWPRQYGEGLKVAAQQEEHLRGILAKVRVQLGDDVYTKVIDALEEGAESDSGREGDAPPEGAH
jgi:hypothetical protein